MSILLKQRFVNKSDLMLLDASLNSQPYFATPTSVVGLPFFSFSSFLHTSIHDCSEIGSFQWEEGVLPFDLL